MPQHNEAPAPTAPPKRARKAQSPRCLAPLRRAATRRLRRPTGRYSQGCVLHHDGTHRRVALRLRPRRTGADLQPQRRRLVGRPARNRRDDDGLSVRWPAGFLLSPGTKGVAAEMTTVDVVINPDGELVFPMPSRLIVDWRPFDDQPDEPFGVSDSIGDLMRNARSLKTTVDASRDDLVRMAGGVVFVDGGYGTHVAEDQIRGVVVCRRNSDMIADFISQFTNPDTLRAVLAAVVFHRTVPAGMSPEKADDLNWLDRHFILSGRGVLAAIDALQFVHRKLASARKA